MDSKGSFGKNPIAIVGMSSLYPESRNLYEFWENILLKRDCIGEISDDYWETVDHFSSAAADRDKTYSKRAGMIPKVNFDPIEFGMPPKVLDSISVVQLLSLITARDALVDAGYMGEGARDFDRRNTGVVLGAGLGGLAFPLSARLEDTAILRKVLKYSGVDDALTDSILERFRDVHPEWSEDSFPGFLGNVIAGRIANRFDLTGPNCTVDAACASSLSAIEIAVEKLALGECNVMVTGGVNIDLSIFSFVCFSKTPALSKTNESRPYAASADGMVLGDGVGMLILKRLPDAIKDEDRIYAVIRGIGSSSDGNAKSIYAPRKEGQMLAMERAYKRAGCSPADISLVEGHGTGTVVGDACEVSSLKEVYEKRGLSCHSVALGSVKSQIGHTRMAAGTASLTKMALALHHKVLPPTINIDKPNPKFNLENSPFFLNTLSRPWFRSDLSQNRMATVSSFGFGGANYHMVLEEYDPGIGVKNGATRFMEWCVLSAEDRTALKIKCSGLLKQLNAEDDDTGYANVDSYVDGEIPRDCPRLGFAFHSRKELMELLELSIRGLESNTSDVWQLSRGVFFRAEGMSQSGSLVAMFSGQGGQYVNMGRDIAVRSTALVSWFERLDQARNKQGLSSVSSSIFPFDDGEGSVPPSRSKDLTATDIAQASIGAFSAGLYEILRDAGFSPDMIVGHSYGELTGLWAAGCISDEEFADLTIARGTALAEESKKDVPGGMIAVFEGEDVLKDILKEYKNTKITNFNSKRQHVLSGPLEDMENLQAFFDKQGIRAVRLSVSHAFHTKYVAGKVEKFKDAVDPISFQAPRLPVFSNVDGKPYGADTGKIKEQIAEQITSSVLFRQCIEESYQKGGRIFVEFGPKPVLTGLVKEILTEKDACAIAVNPSAQGDSFLSLNQAMIQLAVLGIPLRTLSNRELRNWRTCHRKKITTLSLDGRSEYVSKKGRKKLEDMRMNQPAPGSQSKPICHSERSIQEADAAPAVQSSETPSQNLSHVHAQISCSEAHNSFLSIEKGYLKSMNKAAIRYLDLLRLSPKAEEFSVEKKAFHDHLIQLENGHRKNLDAHSNYLEAQLSFADRILSGPDPKKYGDEMHQNPSDRSTKVDTESVFTPVTPTVPSSVMEVRPENLRAETVGDMESFVVQVIAEKTGYPIEVLDLDMDLEADLGVDSIKRIEILSAMNQKMGMSDGAEGLDGAGKAILDGLKTIREIIGFVEQQEGEAAPAPLPEVARSVDSDRPDVEDFVLQIISEKTGYPVAVLGLDMNMESDLGIDSIKRVEILSGIAGSKLFGTALSGEGDFSAEVANGLGNLSTLREVIDFVESKLGAGQGTAGGGEEDSPHSGSGEPSIDSSTLERQVLKIVSEKTGYPMEVLHVDMDLEADLGIDSIKQVDILSGINEAFMFHRGGKNELSAGSNVAAFQGLKTLREILDTLRVLINNSSSGNPRVEPEGALSDGLNSGEEDNRIRRLKVVPVELEALKSESTDRLDKTGPWLVIGEESPVMKSLVTRLRKSKLNITRICSGGTVPGKYDQKGQALTLSRDWTEEQIKEMVEDIHRESGKVGGVVLLHPYKEAAALSDLFSESDENLLRAAFFFLKHLKEDFGPDPDGLRKPIVLVSQWDGQMGMGKERLYPVEAAGGYGLVKSLRWEWPNSSCKIIDINPRIPAAETGSLILKELTEEGEWPIEVGINEEGERITLRFAEEGDAGRDEAYIPDSSSVFLVSGGGRGVTSQCVMGLARKYRSSFILLGRSELMAEAPEWSTGCTDESELMDRTFSILQETHKKVTPGMVLKEVRKLQYSQEVHHTLSEIREAGGKAIYVRTDITDENQLKSALAELPAEYRTITGILHGAGNLADKKIEKKSREDLDKVICSKVKGLRNMIFAVDQWKLRHMVLFSSVSGFFGNEGQTDYAAANETLNKFAFNYSLCNPDCKTVAMNWGPWDGGMMSDQLKENYSQAGIDIISISSGVRRLVEEITSCPDSHEVIISGNNPKAGILFENKEYAWIG